MGGHRKTSAGWYRLSPLWPALYRFLGPGLVSFICLMPLPLQAPLAGPPPEQGGSGDAPHELIVRFADGVQANVHSATHHSYGAYRRARSRSGDWQVVVLPPYADREEIRRNYIADPHVEHVERNRKVYVTGYPASGGGYARLPGGVDESLHAKQWGLQRIGMPAVWSRMRDAGLVVGDASDVLVAVLDTGIDRTHEEFAAVNGWPGNIWENPAPTACESVSGKDETAYPVPCNDIFGWDFTYAGEEGDGQPYDDNGHGTHVAGIIAAIGDNGLEMAGVAWRIRLMALKFLDYRGEGSVDQAVRAIEDYALRHEVDIINASYVSSGSLDLDRLPTSCADLVNQDGRIECEAIKKAHEAGVLVVAAAGNTNNDNDNLHSMSFPAALPVANLIAVAASLDTTGSGQASGQEKTDKLASFSNYGRFTTHLVAPGEEIYSTWLDNGYNTHSGTSMAAPMVTGLAAILMHRYNRVHGEPTNDQARRERMLKVRERILTTVACDEAVAGEYGHGCVGGHLEGGADTAYELATEVLTGGRLDALTAWQIDEDDVPIVPPSHFSVSYGPHGVAELTWLGSSPQAKNYRIERRRPEDGEFVEIAEVAATIGPHNYIDGENRDKETLYRVEKIIAQQPPLQILDLHTRREMVELSWGTRVLPAQGCYEVSRSGSGEPRKWQVPASQTSFLDRPGRGEYTYKVRSCFDCSTPHELSRNCSFWSSARGVSVVGAGVAEFVENFSGFSGGEQDLRCFIATAAYGGPYASEVEALREIRDKYLMPYPAGRGLVSLYYLLSPPIARWIAADDERQKMARQILSWLWGAY